MKAARATARRRRPTRKTLGADRRARNDLRAGRRWRSFFIAKWSDVLRQEQRTRALIHVLGNARRGLPARPEIRAAILRQGVVRIRAASVPRYSSSNLAPRSGANSGCQRAQSFGLQTCPWPKEWCEFGLPACPTIRAAILLQGVVRLLAASVHKDSGCNLYPMSDANSACQRAQRFGLQNCPREW